MKLAIFYATNLIILIAIRFLCPDQLSYISLISGYFFGLSNFYFTMKLSASILIKKGVANPRLLIVFKLLFLLVGISSLTYIFPLSAGWAAGGFLLNLVATTAYLLVISTDSKN